MEFKTGRKIMKNTILYIKNKKLLYFFVSKNKIRTAIFSKINFPTSPNSYNLLILNDILLFYLGEVMGEVWGKYGEVWGKFKSHVANFPKE